MMPLLRLVPVFVFVSWSANQVSHTAETTASNPFPVRLEVTAGRSLGELKPIWRFFGADEPNYATMKDGRKLLTDLGKLGVKGSVLDSGQSFWMMSDLGLRAALGKAGLFPFHHSRWFIPIGSDTSKLASTLI